LCVISDDGDKQTPDQDYYVHIDIVQGSSDKVKERINTHMIRCGSFDPRRLDDFPYTLKDARVRSLEELRKLAGGMSDHCYELWKVHRDFSLPKFELMVAGLPKPLRKTTPKKQPSTSNSPTEQPPNPNSPTEEARTIVKIARMFNGTHRVKEYVVRYSQDDDKTL